MASPSELGILVCPETKKKKEYIYFCTLLINVFSTFPMTLKKKTLRNKGRKEKRKGGRRERGREGGTKGVKEGGNPDF